MAIDDQCSFNAIQVICVCVWCVRVGGVRVYVCENGQGRKA